MPNKPKYIDELEKRMTSMEENQDEQMIKIGQIHSALIGSEYDEKLGNGSGGGLMRRMARTELKVDELRLWKTASVAKNAIIWIVAGGSITGAWSVIILNWDKIFR